MTNNTNKTVKRMKVSGTSWPGRGAHAGRFLTLAAASSVRQLADICLFSTAQYKCTVAAQESE